MRPIKVEFQAFGPYVGHEAVDFEELSSKGLFLICGKTGIGKTMILDAMTFALFGKSSGHGRDVFEAMRCTNAEHDTTTFVKFEFEHQGRYYLFERRLERKRKNLAPAYNLMEKDDSGAWQVVLENAKDKALNEKAEEIIGLKYDQFCQVIILPQGKFERLLTSNSDEKESILTSIFGEYKWAGIADVFYAEADARRNSLKMIRDRIENSLREEDCTTVAELESVLNNKKEEVRILDEHYKKADYDKIIKEQQDILAIVKRFGDLHKAEEKLGELNERKEERNRWAQSLSDAKRADKIRVLLEALSEAEKALNNRKKALEEAKAKEEEAKEKYDNATKALKQHIEQEEAIEGKRILGIQYEGKRKDYESIDKAKGDLKTKNDALKKAETEEKNARAKHDALAESAVILQNEYERLNSEHSQLLRQYLEGITGELAKELKKGEPCPVCGSTEHPNKAKASGNSITEEMVNSKKEEAEQKYTQLGELTASLNEAKGVLNDSKLQVQKAKGEVAAIEATIANLSKNLVPGINTLDELNNEIQALNDCVNAYHDTKKKLEEAEKISKDAHKEARTKIEIASKEADSAQKVFEDADKAVAKGITENGFSTREEAVEMMMSPQDQETLGNSIANHDANVKASNDTLLALQKELKGKKEPDEEKCKEKHDAAISAKVEYGKKKAGLDSEIARLEKKIEALKKEGDRIEDRIREAEEDFIFAKKLRGDSGTGLQRYVLGIMFSSVVTAANKMLEMVHGGRYRLFRSDDKAQGTNKRGLELKVYDKNSDEHEGRFVNTLSGGEKFLASLALSIGMSTVAQRSGIKIEALFIDEGFGSLDDESIEDAMSVLDSIREANGLVGIISHVQILQDQIPSKLRVEADEKGSHIIRTIG